MDVRFASDARALTPLGPRDTIWLKRTAENGLNGIDFFAWWESDLNAKYFLGRALTRMWSDVRWRVPANDAERKLLQYISESLLLAYKLDEGLDYPWVEWSQILDFLDHKEPEFEFVRLRAIGEHNIGYRRGDVTVQLPGNWWIKIPGSFSNFIQDDDDAFLSVDPPKAIWFTAYTFSEDPPTSFMHRRSQPEQLELTHEEEDYVATATIDHSEENGKNYFALKSSNVCLIGRCVCTIVFKRPEERDWAVEVWRSLQPPRRVSD